MIGGEQETSRKGLTDRITLSPLSDSEGKTAGEKGC